MDYPPKMKGQVDEDAVTPGVHGGRRGAALLGAARGKAGAEPVNTKATPEARALLAYIAGLGGKHILSGQHNFPGTMSRSPNG